MKVCLAPAGTRGDVQPALALALALRRAGHQATLLLSPDFLPEAAAFGLEARPLGFDVQRRLREAGYDARPLLGPVQLFRELRRMLPSVVEAAVAGARGADLVVGAGAQVGGSTLAEALGVPYAYLAYSPQLLRSAHHPPLGLPWLGLPRALNRLAWGAQDWWAALFFGAPLKAARAALGLPAYGRRLGDALFPPRGMLLAADPELAPVPPDAVLAAPPAGALQLPDARPLPPVLEDFLSGGPPPVYLGFGSMPDTRAEATTALALAAARRAGVRLVLSGGWARLGGVEAGAVALADRVVAVGPVSHQLLFPRVAAVVHHAGAGTTAAAARAGKPQVLVPHLMDQFLTARNAVRAGVGVALPRTRLRVDRLASAVSEARGLAGRAERLGEVLRGRDAAGAVVRALEELAAGG